MNVFTKSNISDYLEDTCLDLEIDVAHDDDDINPFRFRLGSLDAWFSAEELRIINKGINKALSIQPKRLKA